MKIELTKTERDLLIRALEVYEQDVEEWYGEYMANARSPEDRKIFDKTRITKIAEKLEKLS